VFASAFGFRFRRLPYRRPHVVDDALEVDGLYRGVDAERLGSPDRLGDVRAMDEFLRGVAPAVETGTAESVTLDECDVLARFGGRRGDDIACATAEDDEVVFGHLRSRYQVTSAFVCWVHACRRFFRLGPHVVRMHVVLSPGGPSRGWSRWFRGDAGA